MAQCVTERSECYRVGWLEKVIGRDERGNTVRQWHDRREDFDTLEQAESREAELSEMVNCEAVYLYPVVVYG